MPDYLRATANVPSSFCFDGRRIRPGQPFVSNSPRLTHWLLEAGMAEREPEAVEPGPPVPMRRDVIATAPAQPRKRGRYKRRDLRAEDE